MNLRYGIQNEGFKYVSGVPHSFERNMPSEEVRFMGKKSANFVAAKRDWIAFQVLVQLDEKYTLSVGKRAVFSPFGPLENLRLELKLDHFADVQMNHVGLVQDDDALYKSDILLNDEVIHADKDEVKIVWTEVKIPEDALAGSYSGQVNIYAQRMFEDENLVASMPITIDVKDVLIPETKDYKFHLDLWQHPSNIARKHEVVLWSDDHFRVLEHYIKSLGELGQKSISIIASEIPWSGQGCFRVTNYYSDMFEYNYINVYKNEDGNFDYDFSNVERYIDLSLKYGINGDIDIFGLSGIWFYEPEGYGRIVEDYYDNIRVRYLDKSDNCYKYMRKLSEVKQYISAIDTFFVNKGLSDKVRILTDEPEDTALYNKIIDFLHEAAPSLKFKIAINHAEFIGESVDKIQDFAPSIGCVLSDFKKLKNLKKMVKGNVVWYVACGPEYPNTVIHSPLLECRLIGLMTSYMELDGFLRWNYTVWPEDPRNKIAYKYPLFPAGDTNFVYPANDGRPLLSLRYKNLKRGIQEFELIELLKENCKDSDEILNKVWNKIFNIKNIKEEIEGISAEFNLRHKREELYSLNFEDYIDIRNTIIESLSLK